MRPRERSAAPAAGPHALGRPGVRTERATPTARMQQILALLERHEAAINDAAAGTLVFTLTKDDVHAKLTYNLV